MLVTNAVIAVFICSGITMVVVMKAMMVVSVAVM